MVRHRNGGLRKICRCQRRVWARCRHGWHFNYHWQGRSYRFSLDRYVGRPISSKTEAEELAGDLRRMIRNGTFDIAGPSPPITPVVAADVAPTDFRAFADCWAAQRGYQLVRPRDNDYRLETICAFVLPGTSPPLTFGKKAAIAITAGDIEAFRYARRSSGLSPVTTNHDLKLLRKMFAWGVREGHLLATPFKVGTETVIRLDPETARDRRFQHEDDEVRLLQAATPHLRDLIIAMLDTCCRPGELLSLQWGDVDFGRREIAIRRTKAKTRRARLAPISSRLLAVLEMRRLSPSGQVFGSDAYVFGDEVGQRRKSVRTAWENASEVAGLKGFHLGDLRHEAASRFEEAGVPVSHVSKLLGHGSLTTTTRYLSRTRRMMHQAVQKLEDAQGKSDPFASYLQDPSGSIALGAATPRRPTADKPLTDQ